MSINHRLQLRPQITQKFTHRTNSRLRIIRATTMTIRLPRRRNKLRQTGRASMISTQRRIPPRLRLNLSRNPRRRNTRHQRRPHHILLPVVRDLAAHTRRLRPSRRRPVIIINRHIHLAALTLTAAASSSRRRRRTARSIRAVTTEHTTKKNDDAQNRAKHQTHRHHGNTN